MSRSYRKTPRSGQEKDKFYKRYANRKLRRKKLEHNLQNKTYKKDLCYYDICDYEEVGTSFEEFYQSTVRLWHIYHRPNEPFPDRRQVYKDYCKWFKRK